MNVRLKTNSYQNSVNLVCLNNDFIDISAPNKELSWVLLAFQIKKWSRKWQPTPVFLPRKFHGQRSQEGYIQSMGLQKVGHD